MIAHIFQFLLIVAAILGGAAAACWAGRAFLGWDFVLRKHVVLGVFKRNFRSYFSGVIGYLFIVVFVVLGALLAFRDRFFANNIASLSELNEWFPMLLLFIIPAITMSVWADERKSATDELLFTLPATDAEIVLAKYLAVFAVYSVALFFSLSHVIVLFFLGSPDLGMLFSNYVGYWLAGGALLTAGMVASMLAGNTTVAFVIGAVLCAVLSFINLAAPFIGSVLGIVPGVSASGVTRFFESFGLSVQFSGFSLGMMPVGGLLYFISLAALMLYINMVLVSRRHWQTGNNAREMGLQFTARGISLAVILVSVNVVCGRWNSRIDVTTEQIYSMTETTDEILDGLGKDQTVLVQAFISPTVPPDYVPVRTTLMGLLRQLDRSSQVQVRIVPTERLSPDAEAANAFGIMSRQLQSERGGRLTSDDVFLGAVITAGGEDEVVIPFFDKGTPVEYELARSIATVAGRKRKTVGVLTTDAKVFGGFNMQNMSSDPEWQFITELKKQYDVEQVAPDAPIAGDFDVLIVALPSSLTDPQLDNLIKYVKEGKPTLVLADPLPMFNPGLSPSLPKPRPGGMFGGGQPPAPKCNINKLIDELGIAWDKGEIVWDAYNPHPQFEQIDPEYVFVSAQSTKNAFDSDSEVSSGLQEVMMIYAGRIRPRANSELGFIPLMRTGKNSGTHAFRDILTQGMMGQMQLNRDPSREVPSTPEEHYLAAQITGKEKGDVNVIFVADVDMISNTFFGIRDQQLYGLNLDNIAFVLNSVDVLAGDKTFVPLRKRRALHRTLTTIESRKERFVGERAKEIKKARAEAKETLSNAQAALTKKVAEIRADDSLDEFEIRMKIELVQKTLQRKLAVEGTNTENEKQKRIKKSEDKMDRATRATESRFWFAAILFSPIPALLLGIFVFAKRAKEEQLGIIPERLVRDVRS